MLLSEKPLFYAYVHAKSEAGAYFLKIVLSSIANAKLKALQMGVEQGVEITDLEAQEFAAAYLQRLDGALNHCCLLSTRAARLEHSRAYQEAEARRIDQFIDVLRFRKANGVRGQ